MKGDSMQTKFVAYYRVSTDRQGESGAGLDAQREDVTKFTGGMILKEFKEIESGANDDRPILSTAIEYARKQDATLVIARLDRLARNVRKVFELRDSGVKFVCVDMPDMNTLTIGMFAVVAQYERELIADRTRKGIQAKIKTKTALDPSFKWGNAHNLTDQGRTKGRRIHGIKARCKGNNIKAMLVIQGMTREGFSLREIAKRLNENGFQTSRGNDFQANSIRQLKKVMESYPVD